MAHRVIVSNVGGVAIALPDPVSICPGCEVEWVPAPGVNTFDVKFQPAATPFRGHSFGHANRRSGACQHDPGPGKKTSFKYTLSVNGGPPKDPDVEVNGGP